MELIFLRSDENVGVEAVLPPSEIAGGEVRAAARVPIDCADVSLVGRTRAVPRTRDTTYL